MTERFILALAIMAAVTFACRLAGYVISTRISNAPRLTRLFEILPACAIAAIVGPAIAANPFQSLSLVVAGAIFLLSSRFLLALAVGTGALLAM